MRHALAPDRKYSSAGAPPQPKRRASAPPAAVFSNQSALEAIQRKSDCAYGGECADCKKETESFYGDLDEGIEKQTPGKEEKPADKPKDEKKPEKPKETKAPSCTDICDRAYQDDTLNSGGGGVVCDGATKCACVFDVPPLTRGQCPDFDKVVLNHEQKHVTENNSECDPKGGLHRAKVKDESKLVDAECRHRKASIKELDEAIPKQKGDCKTGMKSVRDLLKTWVDANC